MTNPFFDHPVLNSPYAYPAQPGMQLHKLDKAKDPHFLAVWVSRDIRLIVHRTAASHLLVTSVNPPSEFLDNLRM